MLIGEIRAIHWLRISSASLKYRLLHEFAKSRGFRRQIRQHRIYFVPANKPVPPRVDQIEDKSTALGGIMRKQRLEVLQELEPCQVLAIWKTEQVVQTAYEVGRLCTKAAFLP